MVVIFFFFSLKHILAHAKYHPNQKWLVNIFYMYFIHVDKFCDSVAVLLVLPRSCDRTSFSTAILWQYLYFYHDHSYCLPQLATVDLSLTSTQQSVHICISIERCNNILPRGQLFYTSLSAIVCHCLVLYRWFPFPKYNGLTHSG